MNYELAKELKDAGFPQRGKLWFAPDRKAVSEWRFDEPLSPTLEELIEACGDGISRLWRVESGGWCATGTNDFLDGVDSTPSEAVARLWLKIYGK